VQLGIELRRLREKAGKTPADAGRALDCVTAKISRIELGQTGISLGDLKLLLEFYGADADHAAHLVELSRDNRRRGRWTGDRAVMPSWFRTFFDLESDAADIRIVESEVVPGLFQTERYMRALFEINPGLETLTDVDAAVRSRQEHQALLDRADPPTVSCVLSESCVRRVVGGGAVMAGQLEHLVALAARPRVQLQLWPFDGEPAPGIANGRFVLLRIGAPRSEPGFTFAYCEDPDDARYIDDPGGLRIYESIWGALQAAALGPAETRSRLAVIARDYAKGSPDAPD